VANKTAKIVGGGSLAALLIAVPFIADREGESLKSYRDVVGVWTICNGETLGVKQGMTMTKQQCRQLTESRVGQFMQKVFALNRTPLPAKTLAAHTSFAYNIGIAGYTRSSALKFNNSGNLQAGCKAMVNWNGLTKNGIKYDCNDPINLKINGCKGLVNRRTDEIKLCLSGLE